MKLQFIKKIISLFQSPVYAQIFYLQPNRRLKDKRVIITGGGRGIGAAIAKKFVQEGASVLITGRNITKLKNSAEQIGCKYICLDVTEIASFDLFLERVLQQLGGIDILVNNAGISLHEKSFFDVTTSTFDSQVSTNMKGAYFLTQKVVAYWQYNKIKGNVLFVSSETGDMMDFRPYGFTKVAINSMVQGLAYLFAKDQIRINAIAPGVTASEMTGLSSEGDIAYSGNMIGRVYMPDEVAETACFLASDAAGCISGQIITCNNAKSINARWK